MDISILYEDDDVVVVNKPPGVLVHPDGRHGGETIADWHRARVPEAADVGEPLVLLNGSIVARPGVVHRLDTETSGVLVLAKHTTAFAHLKAEFHDRHAEKTYRAFVYGRLHERAGTIDRPIGRSARDFRLRSAQRGARGKLRDAYTEWECITATAVASYVQFMPKTGRTHQIRVHAKAMNHPVVCDRLYAPNHACILGFARLALHAHTLTLTLPSGEGRTFTAPLPEDFLQAEALLNTNSERATVGDEREREMG